MAKEKTKAKTRAKLLKAQEIQVEVAAPTVAKVDKVNNGKSLIATQSKIRQKTDNATPKRTPKKRKAQGKIVFDEMESNKRPKKRKAQGKIVFDEMESNKRPKTKTKVAKNVTVDQIADPDLDQLVIAHFIEQDQEIVMEVHANEENCFPNEISGDSSEFNSQSDSDHDTEQNLDSQWESDDEPANETNGSQHISDAQEKINDIDKEMATKLNQLKEMMIQGGLTESVEAIEGCLKMTKSSQNNIEQGGNNSNTNATHRTPKPHYNNKTNVQVNSKPSQSAETIYKNAVEKRISNSSTEELDNSDEFIHALSFNNSIVGEAMVERPQQHMTQRKRYSLLDEQPSTSGYNDRVPDKQMQRSPREQADEMIEEAEAAKAVIFPPKGRKINENEHG